MAQIGIGAVEKEEIGKACYRNPEMGFSAVLPRFRKELPASSSDRDGGKKVNAFKAGRKNDDISFEANSVSPGDTGRIDQCRSGRVYPDIVFLQGLEPVAGKQDPFAADLKIGGEVSSEFFGLNAAIEMSPEILSVKPTCGAAFSEKEETGFVDEIGAQPPPDSKDRKSLKTRLFGAGDDRVTLSNDPVGGALKDAKFRCLSGNERHKLNRTRPIADHRDPFSTEVDFVIPPR